MAIYHAALKVFTRSAGQSATAAAAYRSGLRLKDERTGRTHDYTRRHGVDAVEVRVPEGSLEWAHDPQRLWNAAEAAERRVNSCVARELEVSLPAELDADQRRQLMCELADLLVERYGVAVMAALHKPGPGNDARNHHTHLLFSTRALGSNGFGAKVRILDDRTTGPAEVRWLRAAIADRINGALHQAGLSARVDHRRLDVQAREAAARGDLAAVAALARAPTRHLGRATAALLRAQRPTQRGDEHAALLRANARWVSEARQRVDALQAALERRGWAGTRTGAPRSSSASTRTRSHGRPATGPSSASIRGTAGRTASDATRRYLDDLHATVRRINAAIERGMLADREIVALARWTAASGQRAAWLRKALDAETTLREAEASLARAEQRFRDVSAERWQAQQDLHATEARAPKAYNVLSRREWAKKRRDQRQRVDAAFVTERKAWRQVCDGGPLPAAVTAAREQLGEAWDRWHAAAWPSPGATAKPDRATAAPATPRPDPPSRTRPRPS